MRDLLTIRRPRQDFTIPNWAFLLVGRGSGWRAARRLQRAVRGVTGRRRLRS
jgi:hypothetical protein